MVRQPSLAHRGESFGNSTGDVHCFPAGATQRDFRCCWKKPTWHRTLENEGVWVFCKLGVIPHYRSHNEQMTIPSFKNTLNSDLCIMFLLIHTPVVIFQIIWELWSIKSWIVLKPSETNFRIRILYWSTILLPSVPWQFFGVAMANRRRSTWMSSVLSLRRVVAALRWWMWCDPADWWYHWVGRTIMDKLSTSKVQYFSTWTFRWEWSGTFQHVSTFAKKLHVESDGGLLWMFWLSFPSLVISWT